MNRVYVTGDVHGVNDVHKFNSRAFTEGKDLDKQDYVIIAGDFGFIWEREPDRTEEHWMNWLSNKPWTTLVVPGNHENYERINKLPIQEMFGAPVRIYNKDIILLERGNVYTIAGKTFWIMGGALSIDKASRIHGVSYWMEEIPDYKEMDYGISELQKVHGEVDYVITHTCPRSWVPKVASGLWGGAKYNDPTTAYLEEILKIYLFKYKTWYFGHFHRDQRFYDEDGKNYATVLYHNIEEIK